MSTVFRSPGVYVEERDVSGIGINKKQIRKGKINRIFGIKNIEPIIAFPYGGGSGYVVSPNYDELMKGYVLFRWLYSEGHDEVIYTSW